MSSAQPSPKPSLPPGLVKDKSLSNETKYPINQKITIKIDFTIRWAYYLLIFGLLIFTIGIYSLTLKDADIFDSAKIIGMSGILYALGIITFSMFITVRGIEDKNEKEWVRIAMILGGIYTLVKFIELYEPTSMIVEILNIIGGII